MDVFVFAAIIVVLVLTYSGYEEWLKRSEARDYGKKMEDWRAELEAVREERDALRRRIENLEMIVTSPRWEKLTENPVLKGSREEGLPH